MVFQALLRSFFSLGKMYMVFTCFEVILITQYLFCSYDFVSVNPKAPTSPQGSPSSCVLLEHGEVQQQVH